MVMSKPWPSEFCSVPALLRSVASAKVRCSARWTNLFFVAEAEALCVPLPMGIRSGAIAIRAMFAFGCRWHVRAAHERKHDQGTARWSDREIE